MSSTCLPYLWRELKKDFARTLRKSRGLWNDRGLKGWRKTPARSLSSKGGINFHFAQPIQTNRQHNSKCCSYLLILLNTRYSLGKKVWRTRAVAMDRISQVTQGATLPPVIIATAPCGALKSYLWKETGTSGPCPLTSCVWSCLYGFRLITDPLLLTIGFTYVHKYLFTDVTCFLSESHKGCVRWGKVRIQDGVAREGSTTRKK